MAASRPRGRRWSRRGIPTCGALGLTASFVRVGSGECWRLVAVCAGDEIRCDPLAGRGPCAVLLAEVFCLCFPPAKGDSAAKKVVPSDCVLFRHGLLDEHVNFVCFFGQAWGG